MRTSGLVLDLYDDVDGALLKSFYPTQSDLPDVVKTAAALSSDDLGSLPDDLFALVLDDGESVLRKYACYDAGNTALSVLYFLENAHKLTSDMQKTAASNLLKACDWYDLEVPIELKKLASGGFEKVALGLNTVMTAAMAPSVIKGTGQEIQRNRQAVQQAQMATGSPVVTPEQMHHFKMGHVKSADVTGTHLMPLQEPSDPASKKQFVPKKTAEANFTSNVVRAKRRDVVPDTNFAAPTQNEENPQKAPQEKGASAFSEAGRLRPYVSTHDKVPSLLIEKYAHRTALRKYPLDDYRQVKSASSYFEEYGRKFSPEDRHGFCVSLCRRADELGIEVNDEIRKYGSETYAPQHEFEMAMAIRHNVLTDDHAHALLDKLAECRPVLPPELFCATLEEFDKVANIHHLWDSHVFDPYFSTFGVVKTAEEEERENFVDNIGNHRVTGSQLRHAASTRRKSLVELFGEDFADEFRKDPIGIYKSMPREQKIVLMNLSQEADGDEVR